MRNRQQKILLEIEQALKSGFRCIFLEAPLGFGKSPVSYSIGEVSLEALACCTATKDLQIQYNKDFPFIREVKGKGNFPCIVKEDMGLNRTCNYGPCIKNDSYDCIYKTRLTDYKIEGEGTKYETVEMSSFAKNKYHEKMKSHSSIIEQ